MAMVLASLFGKPKPKYNFHNDEQLHDDSEPEPTAWYSNLSGEAKAAISNLNIWRTQGKQQYFKYVASSLDLNDHASQFISKKLVTMLWGSMLHPPPTYRGNEYRYRMADGSNNNVLFPHLGKAGLPFAKTVIGKRSQQGARPDPGDLFDLLMARKDEGVESESGISSMLLYHASIIIHDIFRTDDLDSNVSATSSYLDLAPLYGNNVETQKAIRQLKDGLLKPDTFAETRLLNQPPGVCIYLIMYNRFHNYVAKQLLEINEHGRFALPPGCDGTEEARQDPRWAKAFEARDENLFQTARLITCGMYINIAIHDYLRCLMGVHELDTPWTLDPRKALPEPDNKKGLGRGEGNMVSVEFNLLYRFHSPISRRDAKWSEELFLSMLQREGYVVKGDTAEEKEAIDKGEKFTEQMILDGEFPVNKFKALLDKLRAAESTSNRSESSDPADKRPKPHPAAGLPCWPAGLDLVGARPGDFYRFKRTEGKFDDGQLAAEMCRAIEDPICQFGAQQVPKMFKAIEVMGILQARKWEIATLNEYREFFGMSRFKSFEEINSSKDIQDKLRDLYEDPDLIEFYPGLFCEGQDRKLDPGTSLPNKQPTSLWKGVFSDAVTLVRSDRFYTLDWNVGSLTAWGMKEVTSDPKVNKGSVMNRLFQRAFPGCFEYNSLHMWQPFYTPTKNFSLAAKQGYLGYLSLRGLEDKTGKPHVFTKETVSTYRKEAVVVYHGEGKDKKPVSKNECAVAIKTALIRRTIERKIETVWRGGEFLKVAARPAEVASFTTIREQILGGVNSKDWINPAILEPTDIPEGPLREVMTRKWDGWADAIKTCGESLGSDWEQVFMDYFVGLAQDIRLREQRPLQKCKGTQVYQIDVVKDLAIPVITRFVADFIGFWKDVKTPEYTERELNENDIYRHIENCQNFEAYDSDPTKTWQRRMAYQSSIRVLQQLAEEGIRDSQRGWFEGIVYSRSYGRRGDAKYVQDLRRVGVKVVQGLLHHFKRIDIVAAVMLFTALDAAQRFVTTFTEVIAWFIDPETRDVGVTEKDGRTKFWKEIKELAAKDTEYDYNQDKAVLEKGKNDSAVTEKLQAYVLEASRLSNSQPIARLYMPVDQATTQTEIIVGPASSPTKKTVLRGETILLNLHKAYYDSASAMERVGKFELRDQKQYIAFGPTVSTQRHGKLVEPRFSKQAALIGLTGLLKHCAQLSSLRVAHDHAGRLKRVNTPDGTSRYANLQWDRLVAFPTTWNLRYNGLGHAVFEKGDNADQGHGEDMIWQYDSLSAQLDSYEENKRRKRVAEQKAITDAVNAAVEHALDQNTTTQDPIQKKAQSVVTTTSVAA